jgi:hypothetical protein
MIPQTCTCPSDPLECALHYREHMGGHDTEPPPASPATIPAPPPDFESTREVVCSRDDAPKPIAWCRHPYCMRVADEEAAEDDAEEAAEDDAEEPDEDCPACLGTGLRVVTAGSHFAPVETRACHCGGAP